MANWTVSQSSVSTTQGATVSTSVVLTITPNIGYVISASDFKIGEATNTSGNIWSGGNVDINVNTVTFADIGTAGTATNTVSATVAFDSFSMPGNDKEFFIDIDEKETVKNENRFVCVFSKHFARTDGNGVNQHTITYASAPTGITTTNNTPLLHNNGDGIIEHSHQGTVAEGIAAPGTQVFQVVFATNTIHGYYYVSPPSVTITTGQYSPYWQVVDSALTYTSMTTGGVTDDELTSITYTAYYTPPVGVFGLDPDPATSASAMCELNQLIEFGDAIRQEDQGEPGVVGPEIKTVDVDTSSIPSNGETRNINIYGQNASQFYLKIVSSDSSKTYDFGPTGSGANGTFTATATTSAISTISTSGVITYPVVFPSQSSSRTYDIIIIPISPTTTAPGVPLVANDLRLYQYASVVLSLDMLDGGGEYDDGDFPTPITITGEAGTTPRKPIRKAFSYTITEAMVTTIGSDSLVANTANNFILDNQGSIITLTDGAASSATHDVDSTVGIIAGNTINWNISKTPLFSQESVSVIEVGSAGSAVSVTIPPNVDNLTVGMILSATNIRAEDNVTITSIDGNNVSLNQEITTDSRVDITFTADGVTVDSVTDGDTIVASQSLNLTDNFSLNFGGQESDIEAEISVATSTQSGDNVVLAGTFVVKSFPNANQTVKIDLDKLITIE